MSKVRLSLVEYLSILSFIYFFIFMSQAFVVEDTNYVNENKSQIFSPRLNFDDWTPLGQGDPLKNDPTFDYVPPVLDHVQYWIDSYTTETSTKRDILVLGVTAKKTDLKSTNQFVKLIDAPNFNNNQYNIFKNYFTGNLGAELPKIIRATNFQTNTIDFQNQDRIQPSNSFTNYYYNKKSKPFTIMVSPSIIFKQINTPTYNNYENISNIIPNLDQLVSTFSTQTEKSTFLHEFQQNARGKQNYVKQYLNPKNYSRNYLKLREQTIRNFIPSQHSSQKLKSTDSSISFKKSNIIYQSTQSLSDGSLRPGIFQLPLLQKKRGHSWNIETINPKLDTLKYETNHQLSGSSNPEVIVAHNYNAILNEKYNNGDTVLGGRKNNNTYKNYLLSQQTMLPKIISLNFNQNNASNNFHNLNHNLNFSYLSTPSVQVMIANPPNISNNNHEQSIKDFFSVVIPIDSNKQFQNSSIVKKLYVPKNHLNTLKTAAINKMNKSIQFAKSQATDSTMANSSSENCSSQPLFFNRYVMSQYLNFPLHSIKISTGEENMVNQTSVYLPDIPLSINHIHEQDSANFKKFTDITNSSKSPTTLELHSIPVKEIDQHYQNSRFKVVTMLPLLQFTPSSTSSSTNINFNKQRPEIQSILPQMTQNNYKIKKLIQSSTIMTTMLPYIKTTPISSLTTDPIFSHYKQPGGPTKGPMYLIIQGHSKVKTYKPSVSKHGILVRKNQLLNNIR